MDEVLNALLEVVRAQHSATSGTEEEPFNMDDVINMAMNVLGRPDEEPEAEAMASEIEDKVRDMAPDIFPPKTFEQMDDSEQTESIANMIANSMKRVQLSPEDEKAAEEAARESAAYSDEYDSYNGDQDEDDEGGQFFDSRQAANLNDMIYQNLMKEMGLTEPQVEYPFDRSQIRYGREKTITEQMEEDAAEQKAADETTKSARRRLSAWELAQNAVEEEDNSDNEISSAEIATKMINKDIEAHQREVYHAPEPEVKTKSASQLAAEAIEKSEREQKEASSQAERMIELARQSGMDPMTYMRHQQEILDYMERNSDELVSFEDLEDLTPEERQEIEQKLEAEKVARAAGVDQGEQTVSKTAEESPAAMPTQAAPAKTSAPAMETRTSGASAADLARAAQVERQRANAGQAQRGASAADLARAAQEARAQANLGGGEHSAAAVAQRAEHQESHGLSAADLARAAQQNAKVHQQEEVERHGISAAELAKAAQANAPKNPIEEDPAHFAARAARAEQERRQRRALEQAADQASDGKGNYSLEGIDEEMLRAISQQVIAENAEMLQSEGDDLGSISDAILANMHQMMQGMGQETQPEDVDELMNQVAKNQEAQSQAQTASDNPVQEDHAAPAKAEQQSADAAAVQQALEASLGGLGASVPAGEAGSGSGMSAADIARAAMASGDTIGAVNLDLDGSQTASDNAEPETGADTAAAETETQAAAMSEEPVSPALSEEAKPETEESTAIADEEPAVETEDARVSDTEAIETEAEDQDTSEAAPEEAAEDDGEYEYVDPDELVLGEHTQAEIDDALENLNQLGLEGDVYERAKHMLLLELAGSETELEAWEQEQKESGKKKKAAMSELDKVDDELDDLDNLDDFDDLAEELDQAMDEEIGKEEAERAKAEAAKKAEEARKAEEAKAAEEAKKAEEAKAAEEAKKAEEAKAAEEAKKAEEAKAAEETKKAEEAKAAEEARKAEEAKAAEGAKKAEEAKVANEAKAAEESKSEEEPAREEKAVKEPEVESKQEGHPEDEAPEIEVEMRGSYRHRSRENRIFKKPAGSRMKRNVIQKDQKADRYAKARQEEFKKQKEESSQTEVKKYQVSVRNHVVLKNSASFMEGFEDFIKDTQENQVTSTGFKKLDAMLRYGLHKGSYFVDSQPQYLKNIFMQQMADRAAEKGTDVLFISTELSRYDLMVDTISRLSYEMSGTNPDEAVSSMEIMSGSAGDGIASLRDELNWYRGRISEHLFILDQNAIEDYADSSDATSAGAIITELISSIVQEGVKKPVVIIDNLENLLPAEDPEEMRPLMEALSKLAKELGIPILMSYGYTPLESDEAMYPEEMEFNEEIGYMCDVYLELGYADMVTEDACELTDEDIQDLVEQGRKLLVDVMLHKNRRNMRASCQVQAAPKYNYFE